jgi:hypothetical protein
MARGNEADRNRTALKKQLKKMTLKNKSKLLEKVIFYYGLQFEGFIWAEINYLNKNKKEVK